MKNQKTIGWTPGPLSGAFFVVSGGLETAPALPPSADLP
jgi:hypothetical protein